MANKKITDLPAASLPLNETDIVEIVQGGVNKKAPKSGIFTLEQSVIDDAVAAHANLTNNPHSVTKAQVGLGNVDNTADSVKPVSTAQQTALDLKVSLANIVKRETPSGALPGSSFTTAFPLIAGSEEFFRNGILQDITVSYTITGQNIETVTEVEAWESLKINYIKS